MCASGQGYTEIVKLMIDSNADVNAKNNDGLTALMIAKEENNTEIIRLLTKVGAKEK
jgi:ankyrin repeat protein